VCGAALLSDLIARMDEPEVLDDGVIVDALFVHGRSGDCVVERMRKELGVDVPRDPSDHDPTVVVLAAIAAFGAVGLSVTEPDRGALDTRPGPGERARQEIVSAQSPESIARGAVLAKIATALAVSRAERWTAELFSLLSSERLAVLRRKGEIDHDCGPQVMRAALTGDRSPVFFRCCAGLAQHIDTAIWGDVDRKQQAQLRMVVLDALSAKRPACDCGISMIAMPTTDDGVSRFVCPLTIVNQTYGCRMVARYKQGASK
jgi:hypothetical protein